MLLSRAATRLMAHKLVSFVAAPWLATTTVQYLATTKTLESTRRVLVDAMTNSNRVPGRVARLAQSVSFWKTIILIVTVSKLGNAVLELVNFYLDRRGSTTTDRLKL